MCSDGIHIYVDGKYNVHMRSSMVSLLLVACLIEQSLCQPTSSLPIRQRVYQSLSDHSVKVPWYLLRFS